MRRAWRQKGGKDEMTSAELGQPNSARPVDQMTLADPRILAHPNDFYRLLREKAPVHLDPQLNLYLVSRHEDLQTVLRDPITFSTERGIAQQMQMSFAGEMEEILKREGGGVFPNTIIT